MTSALPIELQQDILLLEKSVKDRLPDTPILLKKIHEALRKDPDNVTLASEEEIAIVFSGLERQTNTYITQSITKAKSTGAKLKNLGVDDL
jgi:hypothetical protein